MGRYCSKSCSNRGSNPSLSKRIPLSVELQIISDYQSGLSKRECGIKHGYGRGGVDKVLKRHGVTSRTVSESLKGRVFSDEWRAKIAANHADVSGDKSHFFGKTPRHGKWHYVEHLDKRVRSTWERDVALALHKCGIEHEYESRRIDLGDLTYMPDFYLPSIDLYIEVKGWSNERWKKVVDRLADRADIRLVVIGKNEYQAIRLNYLAIHEVISHP